jgi:hypothetical protein
MGGNDAGFARVLKRCFLRRCLTQPYEDLDGKEYPSLDAWARERLPRIRQDLIVVYKRLRASFPNARILVLGYPALLPLVEPPFGRDPGWVCHTLFGYTPSVGGTPTSGQRYKTGGSQLNSHIDEAIQNAQSDIEYVDLQSHFAGHEACGPTVRGFARSIFPRRGP